MKIVDLVGNTPLVRLSRLVDNPNVELYGKLEGNNPGGSVKDRAALSMIEGAEARGELKSGVRIIEATSGNTGIALAMIASMKGYEIELAMPENSTRERVLTMEAFGAKVTLTPAKASMEGAIDYVRAEVEKGGCIMLNQFANPDNPGAHYSGTGPEIWNDTEGRVTHFVSAMGTTGTIMGVSKYLKEQNENVEIIGASPSEGSRIPGIRRWPEAYLPSIFNRSNVDRVIDMGQDEAEQTMKDLASKEGIFCGVSSGGSVAAALRLSKELENAVIVAIICDRGDRYLSTGVFS